MDVAVVSNLVMRRDDSYPPAGPNIRLEAQPLQDSKGIRRAAALDLISRVFGLFQQRRIETAQLLALEELYDCDRRGQQDRRQHRGPVNG